MLADDAGCPFSVVAADAPEINGNALNSAQADPRPGRRRLLIRRNGEPTPEDAAAVARATATGSHVEELQRWTELTLARPATRQQ
jgi:hypothetical protein